MLGFKRKRRMARFHLTDDQPSIEGVYMGKVGLGHYRLEVASVINNESASYEVEGQILIPADRVVFIQVFD
jgi:hypothetical protein